VPPFGFLPVIKRLVFFLRHPRQTPGRTEKRAHIEPERPGLLSDRLAAFYLNASEEKAGLRELAEGLWQGHLFHLAAIGYHSAALRGRRAGVEGGDYVCLPLQGGLVPLFRGSGTPLQGVWYPSSGGLVPLAQLRAGLDSAWREFHCLELADH